MISIIMPAYNAAAYITQSIASAQAQTYKAWELIVVDDGSTDDTANIVKQLQQNDNRIVYIYQKNARLGGARNKGITNASGDWIAFLDSDDLWVPEKLAIQLKYAAENTDASVIYTDGYIFYGNDLDDLKPYPTISGKFTNTAMYHKQYETNYIPVLSVLIKKDLVNKIGLQEETVFFHGCEDWDYWLRAARAGATFLGIQEKLFYYRRHASNMSGNSLMMHVSQASVFIKNYDAHLFSKNAFKQKVGPFLKPLLQTLTNNGKNAEVDYLMNKMNAILPLQYNVFTKYYMKFVRKPISAIKAAIKKGLKR